MFCCFNMLSTCVFDRLNTWIFEMLKLWIFEIRNYEIVSFVLLVYLCILNFERLNVRTYNIRKLNSLEITKQLTFWNVDSLEGRLFLSVLCFNMFWCVCVCCLFVWNLKQHQWTHESVYVVCIWIVIFEMLKRWTQHSVVCFCLKLRHFGNYTIWNVETLKLEITITNKYDILRVWTFE